MSLKKKVPETKVTTDSTYTQTIDQSLDREYQINEAEPSLATDDGVTLTTSAIFHFLKENPNNSIMSALEAVCGNFYQDLVPEVVTSVHAHVELNKNIESTEESKFSYVYTSVSSKELPDFSPLTDDPLTPNDLSVKAIENGSITIEEFDAIEQQMSARGVHFDQLYAPGKEINETLDGKNFSIDPQDLKNFRTIKMLALILVASFLLEEDDLHRGNMGKKGRIDFDMSLWIILSLFKEMLKYPDRTPKSDFCAITIANIQNFPLLSDGSMPFYWPAIYRIINQQNKAYSKAETDLFASLANHPIFNYFKYGTFLKYALKDGDQYYEIAKANMPVSFAHNGKKVVDMIKEHEQDRIATAQNILPQVPGFQEFMRDSGDQALANICRSYAAKNEKVDKKIKKYPELENAYSKLKVSIENLKTRYQNLQKITPIPPTVEPFSPEDSLLLTSAPQQAEAISPPSPKL